MLITIKDFAVMSEAAEARGFKLTQKLMNDEAVLTITEVDTDKRINVSLAELAGASVAEILKTVVAPAIYALMQDDDKEEAQQQPS